MLTKAEQKVANFILQALSNAEIASKLNISYRTVKFHATSIYKKVGVRSRAQFITQYGPQLVNERVFTLPQIEKAILAASSQLPDPAFYKRVCELLNQK